MKTKQKILVTILLLFTATLVSVIGSDAVTVFGASSPSQIEVKRTYIMCHYLDSIDEASATYRFGAFAYNHGEDTYTGRIYLNAAEKGSTSQKFGTDISIPANDSTYFRIDFPVKRGSDLEITMLDADDVAISEKLPLKIPTGILITPMYDKVTISTFQTIDEDGNSHLYTGDSLKSGHQMIGYVMSTGRPSRSFVWPEHGQIDCHLRDLYNISIIRTDIEADDILEDCKYTQFNTYIENHVETVLRGGLYERSVFMDCFGINFADTVTMYDNPTLRFDLNSDVITGKDVKFRAAFNTGYPYSSDLVAKSYGSNVNVTYLKPVDGQAPDTIPNFRQVAHTTKFDVATYPLLAGVDTLSFTMEKPDLGEYSLKFTSDYRNGERNMTFKYAVCDTIRSEFDFPKNSFTKGVDTLATFHYKLDKKWPYLLNLMNDEIPSVHIVPSCTHFENKMTKADSLRCDSLLALQTKKDSLAAKAIKDSLARYIEDIADSLIVPVGEYMPLSIEGDYTFSVNNCKAETDSLLLTIFIKNIEAKDIELKYKIFINPNPTEIKAIETDERPLAPDRKTMYNLQGIPVDEEYKGVVIRNGKSYIKQLQ